MKNYQQSLVSCSEKDYEKVTFPKKIKLEISTTLEQTILMTGLLLVVLPLPAFIALVETKIDIISAITGCAISFILGIFLIGFRRLVDEHYVLDIEQRAIMLKSKMPFKDSYTLLVPFSSIDAVVVNGRKFSAKNRRDYWVYRTEIVLSTGKVLPLNDWKKDAYGVCNYLASKIAKITSAQFVQGILKHSATPVKRGRKYTFVLKNKSPIDLLQTIFLVLFLGGVAVLYFFGR